MDCPPLTRSPLPPDDAIVRFPEVPVRVIPDPAVNVTSVPVELFSVTGDEVPVNVRFVAPPPTDCQSVPS